MGMVELAPPWVTTSYIPPVMPPLPSGMKLPTRAMGVAAKVQLAQTSPLVVKAYVPFKLPRPKLPEGGGGVMAVPPPPQLEIPRAAAPTSAVRRRFIAHLAGLLFQLASSVMPEWLESLWCCEPRRLEHLSAQCAPQSRYRPRS